MASRPAALGLLFVLIGMGPVARAEGSRTVAEAHVYAAEHGLPVRRVAAGPADRRVERLFVPVLPHTFQSFTDRFNAGRTGSVMFRYTTSSPWGPHTALGLDKGDNYWWARNYVGTQVARHYTDGQVRGLEDNRHYYYWHGTGGLLITAELEAPEMAHLRGWLAARARHDDTLFCQGNCMEWLPNAEVGADRPLFHALGITRSKDGANMKAKLLHGANERLRVVGVAVNSLEEFDRMSDADLVGNPPAGGLEDAVRP
jgi:hypothetical protein